jgi:predicted lipid carrier protein YhbT
VTDPTAAFFEDLKQREYEPLLARKTGSVRFELQNGPDVERWLVEFDHGKIMVSKRNRSADSTVRADRKLFDRIVQGKANAVTAVLRSEMALSGDWNVMILFQRLFP